MNPLEWKREHQVALLVAAVIGAVVGPLVGYGLFAMGSGAGGALDFWYWLGPNKSHSGWLWTIPGALIAAAVVYVMRLMRA